LENAHFLPRCRPLARFVRAIAPLGDDKVCIIDKTAEPGTTSRSLGVKARTLELYRQLDLADFVVLSGIA